MAERKLALLQKPKKAIKALQYGGKLPVLHKPPLRMRSRQMNEAQ